MTHPASGQAGFSLVELSVAIVIFAVGTLGLAGMTAGLQRQAVVAGLQSERNAVVISVVEEVRAMHFDSLKSGSLSSGRFGSNWRVTPTGSNTKNVQIVTTGPALVMGSSGAYMAPLHPDTLDYLVVRP